MIRAVLRRDLILAGRSGGAWLYGVFFFVVFIALSAIALGGSLSVLREFAAALIWLAVIFSTLLSFPSIFREDYDDGNLAHINLVDGGLLPYVFAKTFFFIILSFLPLLIATPIAGLLFGLSTQSIIAIMASLILAMPAITAYGILTSAILVSNKGGGFLIVLITAPFLIPILIFGLSAVDAFPVKGFGAVEIQALAGLDLIAGAIALPLASAALKTNME